jgi:hypothetical protein
MAKYIFSQGHVFVDENTISPTIKRPEQKLKLSVLLVIRGQRLRRNSQKEYSNAQKEKPT